MERTLCIPLGIIAERSRVNSRWQSYAWRASGVLIGPSRMRAGSPLWRDEDAANYFAGAGTLSLYTIDVPSYRVNVEQPVPRLYVVLAAQERDDIPAAVHFLTAAPDEAKSYAADHSLMLVDALPMPKQLLELVAAYITEHVPPNAPARDKPKLHRTKGSAEDRLRRIGPLLQRYFAYGAASPCVDPD
ncbi:MAG: DUF3305 domain-containing protein [Pseudolabrys sp.]